MITRDTRRADGQTVGEAMDRDAAFLRSKGFDAPDGSLTFDERNELRTEKVRAAVLNALDESLGGKGWTDADLPELFKALDAHLTRFDSRQ